MLDRHRSVVVAALVGAAALLALPGASAHARGPVQAAYDLPADGIRLEGIGVDHRSGAVYVSATNQDGTIYRALPGSDQLSVWVGPSAGANGRGIAVDRDGRVFVAGGPNGQLRVLNPDGTLAATLATGAIGSFLNDLWVAPDGSVYVTDSALPTIWRVAHGPAGWQLNAWLDVSPVISYTPALTDFDLGGITTTADRKHLLVTQGTTGQLWRIDLSTKEIAEVTVAGGPLLAADGIALRGDTLYVVRNFARIISTVRLGPDGTSAVVLTHTPTDPTRTFTTAKLVGGSLLAVDSTFGFPLAPAADRVIAIPTDALGVDD